ncbi:hypothetical protein [Leucothrix pacifica]|uniref:Uncharacterized protein n=1 Tax=Leucothrix pacifica TaxID=1247513 RepID=A0A317CH25_9GAMM|nr:hypothetical protein [Leucothrix pacifica]PWQ97659.1 hypothetical protein DKW60_09770 [Leucothrix pacifica]
MKRIITLPKAMTQDESLAGDFKQLLDKARELIDMGSDIRFVFVENWIASTKNRLPECFAVVDDEYVYLKSGETHSRLMQQNDDIANYQKAFSVNWDRALSLEDLANN